MILVLEKLIEICLVTHTITKMPIMLRPKGEAKKIFTDLMGQPQNMLPNSKPFNKRIRERIRKIRQSYVR